MTTEEFFRGHLNCGSKVTTEFLQRKELHKRSEHRLIPASKDIKERLLFYQNSSRIFILFYFFDR